jgi:hypothetical protein
VAAKLAPLKHGPYLAPDCRPGDRLVCTVAGEQTVTEFSGGPLPWPCFRLDGRRRRFLCGDLELALSRETVAAVGMMVGVADGTASRWRRALKIKPVGSRGWRRKYSDETIAQVRARAAAGETQASLSREYHMSPMYVSLIARGLHRPARPG